MKYLVKIMMHAGVGMGNFVYVCMCNLLSILSIRLCGASWPTDLHTILLTKLCCLCTCKHMLGNL